MATRSRLQAACFLGDEALTAEIAAIFKGAVRAVAEQRGHKAMRGPAARPPQKRERELSPPPGPWQSLLGRPVADALEQAPEALQLAALAGCPDAVLACAPVAILRAALAARCAPLRLPRDYIARCADVLSSAEVITLQLPASLLQTWQSSGAMQANCGAALAGLPHVECAIVSGGFASNDEPAIPKLAPLSCLSGSRALHLMGWIQDDDLADVSELAGLRQLRFKACNLITGAGLAALGGLAVLSLLSFDGCRLVSDAGLAHFSGFCALRELDVVDCPAVRHFAHLRRLTSLRSLDLSDCGVGDVEVAHLGSMTGPHDLCLNHAMVSDAGLACVLDGMQLRNLRLRKCAAVGNASLAVVSMCLRELQVLDFQGCCVTNEGLAQIRRLRSLSELWLGGRVASISDEGPASATRGSASQRADRFTQLVDPPL